MNNLFNQLAEHAIFVLEFAGIVILMFVIAYVVEKLSKQKDGNSERILSTKKVVIIGVFSAISTVLMLLEFPLFFAPGDIYKMDFSELPALLVGFAYGPVSAVMVELVKIILKTLIKGTSTAFVGELANFVVGCSFLLPATIIYRLKKTKKTAIVSCIAGTLMITAFGSFFNAVYLIPTFAGMYGIDVNTIVGMGQSVNSHITSITSFIFMAVAPFNLLKGIIDSVITVLIYKRLRPIMK